MKQFFIGLDQLLNTIVWIKGDGFGFADETLSARAWRLRNKSRAWKVIDTIFFWETEHCKNSYDAELARKHYPSHYKSEKNKYE
jgi:hypothetical protein